MGADIVIPSLFFLVTGAIIISYFYLRWRERQIIIERGLSTEQMMALYKRKRDPILMLKLGIVVFFFGIGLGLGLLLSEMTGYEEYVPFFIFTITGLGFILAYFASRKFDKDNSQII